MAEDFDVEAMLEAPYKKNDELTSSSSSKHRNDKHSDKHKHSDRSKDSGRRSGDLMAHQITGRRTVKLTTVISPEGKEVEVEKREDPEEKAIADKIVGLFIEAGYYQINHEISLFHKITSGMIWCLQSANYGFDTDSFAGFDQQTNIRNKIFLSEKIIRVLLSKAVKCPHVVQPHQILGLDVEHIFPLIKWLVNHCVQLKKHHKDDYLHIASQYLTSKQFFSTLLDVSEVDFSFLYEIIRFYSPYRKFLWNSPRRVKQNPKFCRNEFSNVVYKNFTDDDIGSLNPDTLIPIEKHVSKGYLIDEFSVDRKYKKLRCDLPFRAKLTKKGGSKINLRSDPKDQKVSKESKTDESIDIKETYKENEQCATIDLAIDKILHLNNEKKKLDYEIKSKEQREIKRSPHHRIKSSYDHLKTVEVELDEELRKYSEQTAVHGTEDWSKAIEKQVYLERLNELKSQVVSVTVQTKQHYAHFNTLIDIQEYKNKETNLLNSVIENYERAKSAKSYQDQYLNQLENVADWVKQTKAKLLEKYNRARNKRNEAHRQWSLLMQMERDYAKVTRDIKLAVS